MRSVDPIPRRLWRALFVCLPCAVVCAGMLMTAVPNCAQDVAEAARKAKEQKTKDQKAASSHIYTNDDLKKKQILTPGDQARAGANKKNSPAAPPSPAEQQQQASDKKEDSVTESLGEVARRYRREKAEREAQEALKKQPANFPMSLPAQEFASPKPLAPLTAPKKDLRAPVFRNGVATAPGFSRPTQPVMPEIVLPSPRSEAPLPSERTPVRKISPFQRRPLIAPSVPSKKIVIPFAPGFTRPASKAPSNSLMPLAPVPVAPSISAATPSVAPKAVPVTAPTNGSRIVVQRGDSLWKISREYLGRGSRWQELAALNPNVNAQMLMAGSELVVPERSIAKAVAKNRGVTRRSMVTVQSGDTLWSIANAHLGSGLAWTCIAQANGQLGDPNRIFPGETISIPAACLHTNRK